MPAPRDDRALRLRAQPVKSSRVCLAPLRARHAEELAPLLADAALHRFIGGTPPDLDQVRSRFLRQSHGASPDGREVWLNWVVRTGADEHAVGTVQATVLMTGQGSVAELAWVIATAYQGHGFAKAAARLMARWLSQNDIHQLCAYIHPEHLASQAVAASVGLLPTEDSVNGERRWQRPSIAGSWITQHGDFRPFATAIETLATQYSSSPHRRRRQERPRKLTPDETQETPCKRDTSERPVSRSATCASAR